MYAQYLYQVIRMLNVVKCFHAIFYNIGQVKKYWSVYAIFLFVKFKARAAAI